MSDHPSAGKGRLKASEASGLRLALIATAVAVVVTLIDSVAIYLGHHHWRWQDPLPRVIQGILPPWLLAALLAPIVRLLVRRYPLPDRPIRAIPVHVIAALLFPIVHLALLVTFHVAIGWMAPGQTWSSELADLIGFYYGTYLTMYFGLAALFHALDAREEVRQRLANEAALRADLVDARLQALRQQLSPHFLFNVLNTVSMLVRRDLREEATTTLADLSELLRYLLNHGGTNEVSLREELDIVRRYLALEQVRFHDRLLTRVDTTEDVLEARVPSLILQPLVENAIRHGMGDSACPGSVILRARREGVDLVLEVHDSGNGSAGSAGGTGIGLTNTRARLRTLYGDRFRLDLAPDIPRGTTATIRLPFNLSPAPAPSHA